MTIISKADIACTKGLVGAHLWSAAKTYGLTPSEKPTPDVLGNAAWFQAGSEKECFFLLENLQYYCKVQEFYVKSAEKAALYKQLAQHVFKESCSLTGNLPDNEGFAIGK
jgi:hypothetical protein